MVIGGTGAVGSSLVRELLSSPRFLEVTIVTRRPVGMFAGAAGSAKLTQRVTLMDRVEHETRAAVGRCDVGFCTLGIGQPRKVSRAEFHKVDIEYAAAFARACRAAGVLHMSLLTSVGANARSRNFYLKTKGAVEDAFRALAFPRLSVIRPSLLVTKDIRYGLQDRIARVGYPLISRLLPSRLHEIRVEALARAMRLNAERHVPRPVEILHYAELQSLLRTAERL